MNCAINKHTIEKLLKLSIEEIETKIGKVDELLSAPQKEKTRYKLVIFKRALQIILVSKLQSKDVTLQTINELLDSSNIFSGPNISSDSSSAAPRKR